MCSPRRPGRNGEPTAKGRRGKEREGSTSEKNGREERKQRGTERKGSGGSRIFLKAEGVTLGTRASEASEH